MIKHPVRCAAAMAAVAVMVAGLTHSGSAAAQEAAPTAEGAAPTLTVTPTADLVDGQAVTVTGRGFGEFVVLEANECRTRRDDSTLACGNEFGGFLILTENGRFSVSTAALAALDLPKGRYDCRPAPGRCVLRLRAGRIRMDVPLTFKPSAALLDPPTLTVTPSTDLVDGQIVDVHGAGFQPDDFVYLELCPAGARTIFACVGAAAARPDATGAFDTQLPLDATLATSDLVTDCRSAPCELVAANTFLFGRTAARTPLGFDSAGPLRPPPTLTVTPSTNLTGGQIVQVHGEGFAPLRSVQLLECKGRALSIYSCGIYRSGPRARATADASGDFDVAFQVRPTFGWLPGPPRNCRISRCAIGAYDGDGPVGVADEPLSALAPITFAPR